MAKEKGNLMDLEAEVIYNGLCCYCGSCGAFCKEYISYENELPKTKKKCYEICGACYDFCPRTFFAPFEVDRAVFGDVRTDNLLGYYLGELLTARATDDAVRDKAQDGGVVSALLAFLLEHGEIDAAVVSKTSENWEPEPFVATKREDILAAAGSKYTQCPSVLGVGDAFEVGYKNIALVGLPCHIQGMRKVQLSKGFDVGADRVKLLIGLLCTETFDMAMLTKKLEELGTSIEEVEKFNIKKGRFIVQTKAGKEIKTPIRKMRECVREACNYCYDFAAEFADISVGSVGSENGWSTVIMRSEAGEDLVKRAEEAGLIETKKLSEEQIGEVRNLASFKKRENLKHIYEKTEPISILNMQVEPKMLETFLGGE
jgi:coenzyme F420 hydrogenase subunit beta